MMCINQCEKPLTIGFCRANKNRNVIAVSEDTDQSSPSVSDWLPLCLILGRNSLWRFERKKVSSIIQIFQSLISVWDSNTPTPSSCQRWPCQQRLECTETFMLDYFYFKEFPSLFSSYIISDATLCKFMAMNHWLIEIKSLYVDLYGLYRTILNLDDGNICVFAFHVKRERTWTGMMVHHSTSQRRFVFNYAEAWLVLPCRTDAELISPIIPAYSAYTLITWGNIFYKKVNKQ